VYSSAHPRDKPGFGSKIPQPCPIDWVKAYIFCQQNAMTKPDDEFTVKSHFKGKDLVRLICDRLLKSARKFDRCEGKTQESFDSSG